MTFRMRSATSKKVVLKSGRLEYFGHKSMVEFLLEKIVLQDGLCFSIFKIIIESIHNPNIS